GLAARQLSGAGLQRPVRLGAGDGDHRLLGEGLQQLDLAVGEAAALSASKSERADRGAAAYQRDRNARLDRQAPHGGMEPRFRLEMIDAEDPAIQDRSASEPLARWRHR